MSRTLSTAVLLLMVLPTFLSAQTQDAKPSCSGYCSMFAQMITQAKIRKDGYFLEKLEHDLERMTTLSAADKSHVESLIKEARSELISRDLTNAKVRVEQILPGSEADSFSLVASAPPQSSGYQPHAGDEMVDIDALEVPQGDSLFDECKRIILFAFPRRDVNAVSDLESRLADMGGLTDQEKEVVGTMIAEFHNRTPSIANSSGLLDLKPLEDALGEPEPVANDGPQVVMERLAAVIEETGDAEDSSAVATGDANKSLRLPASASTVFSTDYLRSRRRFLDYFFFEGMTATELDVTASDGTVVLSTELITKASFGDQTLHMGQALLMFAGEARVLKANGISSESSERAIKVLLDAFDLLDAADKEVYGSSTPGFFVRDAIHDGDRMGVPWPIKSDMNSVMSGDGEKWQNAMSIDQTTSLFVGWWGVCKWSSNEENVNQARRQIDTVMKFLMDSKFIVRLPNGDSIPNHRGPDFRYAAGFLCRIAEDATGNTYFDKAKIDITIKGDPIRFRDDNLGEFEIPGFKIPADMPVPLSHAAVLSLTPVGIVGLAAPPKIVVRLSDLIPGADKEVDLPCAHFVQAHPGGDTSKVVCVHLTAAHPGGDPGPKAPCTHVVKVHPDGDTAPCLHMTAKHPGGDDGPTVPCTHLTKEHDHDWIEKTIKVGGLKKTIKTKVPCTHIGPKHPGGHKTKVPCVHLVPAHSGGHKVPCVHTKLKHPGGHDTKIPCVHLVKKHPKGHEVTVPCVHMVQAHPSGHGFDLKKLDVEIPLGEKLHSYSRHIALQCLAFEPALNGTVEFLPPALNSNHVWSALLRSHAVGDVPVLLLAPKAKVDYSAISDSDGPNNIAGGPWVRSNRWERCTELDPDDGGPYAYNGVDFMSLEVLMRLANILD